jgi:GT2 family glycosyltransferase
MRPVRVEIVTPVFNRLDETLRCLRSIERSDTTGISLHTIIVDDGSTDGSGDVVSREYPNVEVVSTTGDLWYTAGANLGIQTALEHSPDYVLLINNDQVFDEQCIRRLVECAERHPNSVIGGLLLNRERPHQVFQVSPRWETLKGGFRHWYKQTVWTVPCEPWRVELIVGNCVLIPVEAIRALGVMDARRLPQYGDAEYTPRLRRAGWQLLVEPRARVFCKPNDVITGFRSLPPAQKLKKLFSEPMGGYSVLRRFYGSVGGAPSFAAGIAAFTIGLVRAAVGRSYEASWAHSQPEPPLSETFADCVVND